MRRRQLQKQRKQYKPKKLDDVVPEKEQEVAERGVIFTFALDDMRIGPKDRLALFETLKSMVPQDKPEMLSHLERVYTYYGTSKRDRVWQNPEEVKPTNIIVAWDDNTPKMRSVARRTPFDLIFDPVSLSTMSCFMFYNVTGPCVHILNWYHEEVLHDDDYYLKHMIGCVGYLKQLYLAPGLETSIMMAEIEPIGDTLIMFSLYMDFELLLAMSSTKPLTSDLSASATLIAAFKKVFDEKDFDGMRGIADDPRYRTTNKEGVNVLRLFYYPKTCECVSSCNVATMLKNRHLVCSYQCESCKEIHFCSKKCTEWQNCC